MSALATHSVITENRKSAILISTELQKCTLIINQIYALITQIYFWNKTLHISDSSSVPHQDFFTVHTAMVYVIQVC